MKQRHKPTSSHNYVPLVTDFILAGKIYNPAELEAITVTHDDWCDIHTEGFCNCKPLIRKGKP